MDLWANKSDLKRAMERLVRVVPKDAEGGVSGVHLASYDSSLTLTASNGVTALSAVIPATSQDTGWAVLPARAVLDALKTHKDKTINVHATADRCWVGTTEVLSLPASEFRPMATPPFSGHTVASNELKRALKHTLYATAPGWDVRPEKRSVHFTQRGDEFSVLVADTWRMAHDWFIQPQADGPDFSIASESAELLMRLLPDKTTLVTIATVGPNVFFVVEDEFTLTAATSYDGTYDYVRLFDSPRNSPPKVIVEVAREGLLTAAKSAKDALKGLSFAMNLEAGGGLLKIAVPMKGLIEETTEKKRTAPWVRAEQQMACRSLGTGSVSVNPAFLADALAAVEGATVHLGFAESVLQVWGDEGEESHTIAVMI